MTLLEDLEASAQIADLNAEECEKAGSEESAQSCRTFAKRQRLHAERLRCEIERADEKARLPWSEGRTKALLERINGGLPPETDVEVSP